MKHLKHIFENISIQDKSQEDKLNVEDICLELSDIGFEVMVTSHVISKYLVDPYIRIKVTINKPKGDFMARWDSTSFERKTFRYPEIKEVVERLKDCLSDYVCQVIVQFVNDGEYKIWDLEDGDHGSEIKNGNTRINLSQIIFTN